MNSITLVCTRSAINASALTYMINQSPDYYNVSHNNLWLNEISDRFGTAHTLNDWWNIPLSLTAYNKDIRNANVLTLQQLEHLSDNIQDLNLGKDIALFTHATNHSMISEWTQVNNLPVRVVTTNMGTDSHYFVTSWLRREYNQIMNDWQDQESAWRQLVNNRTVQDSQWASKQTLNMYDWLIDPQVMYNKLNIKSNNSIDIWLNEYLDKNGISIHFDPDQCWKELGDITKLQTMLWLVNNLMKEKIDINTAQLYAYELYNNHVQNKQAHYTELDTMSRQNLGLTTH